MSEGRAKAKLPKSSGSIACASLAEILPTPADAQCRTMLDPIRPAPETWTRAARSLSWPSLPKTGTCAPCSVVGWSALSVLGIMVQVANFRVDSHGLGGGTEQGCLVYAVFQVRAVSTGRQNAGAEHYQRLEELPIASQERVAGQAFHAGFGQANDPFTETETLRIQGDLIYI